MGALALALALTVSAQAPPAPGGSCRAIEQPAAPGLPHILIPPGAIPETGPLEFADRLRRGRSMRRIGFGAPREITCVEFVPPTGSCSAGQPRSCGRWQAHVEAPFWFRPPLSRGSCRASHGLVTLPDSEHRGHGGSLLDPDCSGLRYPALRKGP
jgi:hypothetical protein